MATHQRYLSHELAVNSRRDAALTGADEDRIRRAVASVALRLVPDNAVGAAAEVLDALALRSEPLAVFSSPAPLAQPR